MKTRIIETQADVDEWNARSAVITFGPLRRPDVAPEPPAPTTPIVELEDQPAEG